MRILFLLVTCDKPFGFKGLRDLMGLGDSVI